MGTIICALITGACTIICAAINAGMTRRAKIAEKDQQEARAKQKAVEEDAKQNKLGTLALLHDRLYQACNFYISRGWITADDLRNLEYMYTPYAAMGGNGTCKILMEHVKELDIRADAG